MGASGPDVEDVPGWHVGLLLLAFATVTFILEKILELIEKALKNQKGLLLALNSVKMELLYLGVISLLLSAFQNEIAKICIDSDHSKVVYEPDPAPESDRSKFLRMLLGGAASVDPCPEGQESLWPVSLQHDTHMFIFSVACTHIVYCTITIYLTFLKVRVWRRWEVDARRQAKAGDVRVMQLDARWLHQSVGSNRVRHVLVSLYGQFRVSVTQPMYHNVRLLFIERMGLAYDFDFHSLVKVSMEEELARTVRTEWPLWLVAVIWFVLPPPSYVAFWSYGLALTALLLVGGKLVDIVAKLCVQVALKYGDSVLYGRMATDQRGILRKAAALGRTSLPRISQSSMGSARTHTRLDNQHLLPSRASRALGDVGAEAAACPAAASAASHTAATAAGLALRQACAIERLASKEDVVQMLKKLASQGITHEAFGLPSEAAVGAAQPAELAHGAQPPGPGGRATTMLEQAHGGAQAAAVQPDERFSPDGKRRYASEQASPGLGTPSSLRVPADARGAPKPAGLHRSLESLSMPVTTPWQQRSTEVAAELRQRPPPEASSHFGTHASAGGGGGSPLGAADSAARRARFVPHKAAGTSLAVINEMPSVQVDMEGFGADAQRQQLGTKGAHGPRGHHGHGFMSALRAAVLRKGSRSFSGTVSEDMAVVHEVHGAAGPAAHAPQAADACEAPAAQDAATAVTAVVVAPEGAAATTTVAVVAANGEQQAAANAAAATDATGSGKVLAVMEIEAAAPTSPGAWASPFALQQQQLPVLAAGHPNGELTHGSPAAPGGSAPSSSPMQLSPLANTTPIEAKDDSGRRPQARRPKRAPQVGFRRVSPLMRCIACYSSSYQKTPDRYVKDLLARKRASGFQDVDAAEFFWFMRPKLISRILTYAYFENSLSIALIMWTLVLGFQSTSMWDSVSLAAMLVLLAGDCLIVLHSALYVLPLYALLQPVGSHCPEQVLKRAIKGGMYTKQAQRLAKAMNLTLEKSHPTQRAAHNELPRRMLGAVRTGIVRAFPRLSATLGPKRLASQPSAVSRLASGDRAYTSSGEHELGRHAGSVHRVAAGLVRAHGKGTGAGMPGVARPSLEHPAYAAADQARRHAPGYGRRSEEETSAGMVAAAAKAAGPRPGGASPRAAGGPSPLAPGGSARMTGSRATSDAVTLNMEGMVPEAAAGSLSTSVHASKLGALLAGMYRRNTSSPAKGVQRPPSKGHP